MRLIYQLLISISVSFITEGMQKEIEKPQQQIFPFHDAARAGNVELIKKLAKQMMNIELRNEKGETALHCAAAAGKLESVRCLVEMGAQVEVSDKAGNTPLMKAHYQVKAESQDVIAFLEARGARKLQIPVTDKAQGNISMQNLGRTPLRFGDIPPHQSHQQQASATKKIMKAEASEKLFFAAYYGEIKTVRELLDLYKDIANIAHKYGETPLHAATKGGRFDVVKLLLERGAQVNTCNSDHESALLMAAANGDGMIAELLLKQGALINIADNHGTTPLHAAIKRHEQVMAELVDQGLDNSNNSENAPKLFNSPEVLFLEHGADVNAADVNGNTPLHVAVEATDSGVMLMFLGGEEKIVTQKVNINAKNNKGETPLFIVIRDCHKWIGKEEYMVFEDPGTYVEFHEWAIDLLLYNGADINAANDKGETPLFIAARDGLSEVARLLLDMGADASAACKGQTLPLSKEGQNAEMLIVKLLQEKQPLFNKRLYEAGNNGNVVAAKDAINAGAEVNYANASQMGRTPLHAAASKGHSDVMELLLAKKASIDSEDKEGKTPLHYAAGNGHLDVVRFLLAKGATLRRAKDGESPSNAARNNGHMNVVRLLGEQYKISKEEEANAVDQMTCKSQ